MADDTQLKRTALYEKHVELGARMAAFGGYLMPIQYRGIVAEHEATRHAAAIFDTCHMGEFRVEGATAVADLERLVSCDVASLAPGRCRYGMLCNPAGGVIDDLLVYRMGERAFMIVVNAGTQDYDFEWITAHLSSGTTVANLSAETAKLDVQGPGAVRIVRELLEQPIDGMVFYSFRDNVFRGAPVLVSRTGYTGEIGFEIYGDADTARTFWEACCAAGAVPAGLGARDTLRLEMGMPLYGHELSRERNAAEAGFLRAMSGTKTYIGCEAIRDTTRHRQALVGIALEGRRAARAHDAVLDAAGHEVGVVTSGSFAPSLGTAVALAYVDHGYAQPGTPLVFRAGRQDVPGRVVELPFYKSSTGRRPLADFV